MRKHIKRVFVFVILFAWFLPLSPAVAESFATVTTINKSTIDKISQAGKTEANFSNFFNSQSDDSAILETDGIYDVAGRPDIKLSVIVNKMRPNSNQANANRINSPLVCTDPNSMAVDGKLGWHLPSAWTYNLNLSSAPSSIGSNLAQIANNAFGVWSQASGNKVTFSRGADTTTKNKAVDNKHIIAWGPLSGSTLGVTYTWYYTSTHQVAETDTILNKNVAWRWANACFAGNYYDVQDILTHELGHWMGLSDQYANNYSDNTMYGYGAAGEIKKDTPASGDIQAVSAIYSK